MSKGKVAKFINDNIVMLVGIPLIIGVHYGWLKLQEIPYLVDQSKKKDIPIVEAFRSFKNKLMVNSLTGNSSSSTEPQEEK